MEDNEENDKKKVLVIAGYGPSIGYATARKFSSSNKYFVALLGRTRTKLEQGVEQLSTIGVTAKAFLVDCGNEHAIRKTVKEIRNALGPISTIVWNAASYAGPDLLAVTDNNNDDDESDALTTVLHEIVDVSAVGLIAMVQASREDLKSNHGSVLITGGGLSSYDQSTNQVAVDQSWHGLALCKSIQRKLAGLLSEHLKNDRIFVGSVIISGPVRIGGGSHDDSTDPNDVASAFWEMHQEQKQSHGEIHLGSLRRMIEKQNEVTVARNER
jgi:NAD(P)-dependent dehydrogenase (short-subunit alcohol dehydrogenase family)